MLSRIPIILVVFAWLLTFAPASQAAETQLTIGACAPGCTGIIIAGGFAAFVTKEIPGVSVIAPTSKGFVYNIRGMERGTFDFALGSTGVISQAVEGKSPSEKNIKTFGECSPSRPFPTTSWFSPIPGSSRSPTSRGNASTSASRAGCCTGLQG